MTAPTITINPINNTVGENGTWSANASHFPFDGIYNATAFAPEQRYNFPLFVIFA